MPPTDLLEQLRERVRQLETGERTTENKTVSSGCAALDRLLPGGGFARGTLVEWLSPGAHSKNGSNSKKSSNSGAGNGSGAGSLALITAREALSAGGVLVVMDRQRWFYPPAVAAYGLDPRQLIVIQPANQQDELWALDQVLRCPGVAAAWAPLDQLESHTFRRLQLAAEQGGSLGLLLRPASFRGQPSWSDVQLVVQPVAGGSPVGWRLQVQITRLRSGRAGGKVTLEMDDTTGKLRLSEVPQVEVGRPKSERKLSRFASTTRRNSA